MRKRSVTNIVRPHCAPAATFTHTQTHAYMYNTFRLRRLSRQCRTHSGGAKYAHGQKALQKKEQKKKQKTKNGTFF